MNKEEQGLRSLSDNLKYLAEINSWFDNQEDPDIEEGLKKVKEAVEIIKISKKQLNNIENEFEEIKKEMDVNSGDKEEKSDILE